ncbi:MAG TPA: hypothetical protein VKN36_05790 [Eudoraea sp.]|nr:hypothetical protein [Eudoraea sp.]
MTKPENYHAFIKTLELNMPAEAWPLVLQALWWDLKGNWVTAHQLMDGANIAHADWVHAYLHRKEGDQWNAGYWYRKAGKPFPDISLEEEQKELLEFFLRD